MARSHKKGAAVDRYACVPTRTADELRALGFEFAPCTGTLYLWLLSCPFPTRMPGVIAAGPAAIAEALNWDAAVGAEHMRALETAGLVVLDRAARVLYLPEQLAAECSRPASPSVAAMWRRELSALPPCDLRERIIADARAIIASMNVACVAAFVAAFDAGTDPQTGKPKPRQSADQTGNHPADQTGNQSGGLLYSGSGSVAVAVAVTRTEEIRSEEDPAAGAADLFGTASSSPVGVKKKTKPKADPLPFAIGEALEVIRAASGDRVVVAPFVDTLAPALTKTVRAVPSLADWKLAGEWIAAGGLAWEHSQSKLDLSWLSTRARLASAVGHARKWSADGRPAITRSNGKAAARGYQETASRPATSGKAGW